MSSAPPSPVSGRHGLLGAALLVLVLALAFVGRSVTVIDGALVISDTVGFLVKGRFQAASAPTVQPVVEGQPAYTPPADHSQYGLYPSLLPLPSLALVWPVRASAGPRVVESFAAFTWALGAALCALAFLRLARVLSPGASPLWAPAFLAGTFLWPFAAESFVEPWAAALLALGAERLLTPALAGSRARGLQCAVPWALACLLKPVLWLTAPVLLLSAAFMERRDREAQAGLAVRVVLGLAAGAGVFCLTNLIRNGSLLEVGYGPQAGSFTTPLLKGLVALTLLPGRSLFLFAPLAAVALLAIPKIDPGRRLVLLLVPLVHLTVVSRWWCWDGGGAWGPRHLLPVLPLLAAPAVLLSRRLTLPAVAFGVLVNLPGVLVTPGAWVSYAERLPGPAAWPAPGNERVATVPVLFPIYGHVWLLAPRRLPAPWLTPGDTGGSPPQLEAVLSPMWARRLLSLPPISPVLPRVILGIARNYAARGEMETAFDFVKAAREIDPLDPAGRLLEEQLRSPR